MSDINEIKKEIQELRDLSPGIGNSIPFGESQALLKKLGEFQQKAPERLLSLITTIESLQKKMDEQHDRFYNEVRFAYQQIESQKEEIERLTKLVEKYRPKCCEFETIVGNRCMSCEKVVAHEVD